MARVKVIQVTLFPNEIGFMAQGGVVSGRVDTLGEHVWEDENRMRYF